MILYKRHENHPFKWILGMVIFVLVLTVTFDEVFGLNLQPTVRPGGDSSSNVSFQSSQPTYNFNNYCYPDSRIGSDQTPTPEPPEIPEPTTLILLASGLGALHLIQRKKRL